MGRRILRYWQPRSDFDRCTRRAETDELGEVVTLLAIVPLLALTTEMSTDDEEAMRMESIQRYHVQPEWHPSKLSGILCSAMVIL